MAQKSLTKSQLRFALDAIVGLIVFMAISSATLGPSAAAGLLGMSSMSAGWGDQAALIPLTAQSQAAIIAKTEIRTDFLVLAGVFSALFALNFAFVRHLRQSHIYARKRERARAQAENMLDLP